ncbi:hypothetical protein ABZ863_18745 [Saccharomonospora sp. NPDC046836]|uniref:hypothetical protein n=1 Tax=Saccharomonospora sp. NPDC046836 TaxID=3156921 RepID=UPI0033FA28A6
MLTDSTKWATICEDYDKIRVDAFAFGYGDVWEELMDSTRSGSAKISDWAKFLSDVNNAAEGSQNIISKGDPFQRRSAALHAMSGGFVCATGRCDRSASPLTATMPPQCPLFDRPMAQD